MRINPMLMFYDSNVFKNNTSNNNVKYKKIAEKRAYIDNEVKIYEDLSTVTLIGSLLAGVMNIDTSKKLKLKEITGLVLLALTGVFLVVKWGKQAQLSKKYDNENLQ